MTTTAQVAAAVKAATAGGTTTSPVPAVAPPSVFPAVVTAIGTDGTITVTLNGASVMCESHAEVAVTGGETVNVLIYNNVAIVVGLLSDAQSLGGGFLPGDLIETLSPATTRPGWLPRDGSAISRTTYARLFAVIGTTYGVGDGSTTFNLPNDLGLFMIGKSGTFALGSTGGATTVALSIANLPVHSHANTATGSTTTTITPNPHSHFDGDNTNANSSDSGTARQEPGAGSLKSTSPISLTAASTTTVTMTNASTGSGTAVNILPPYRAVNRWIKT